ncbi:MAG TPA: polyprenyl synthetase family protein [Edaphocola sp.]|nr:polyprenyl synthetase family protein [Edaphocola sp.]
MQIAKKVIEKELKAFESHFSRSVKTNNALLDRIMNFIIKRKGKQMRPMFVFLSAKIIGETQESTYRAAALIELLHTASLVHDDVVDDSNLRRGFFSINALWKNKVAVLLGDYLLAKGLLLSVEYKDFETLRLVSTAVKEMSEGELLQIEKARKLDIKEEVYFEIIRSKTASLLAAACAVGAWSVNENSDSTERMRLFGEKLGICFQIKDDLFDYGFENIGKPTGNDIKEKKMTLPLIYTLGQVDIKLKKKLIYIVKNGSHKKDKVEEVINTVKQYGGIEYATKKMYEYQKEALEILHTFPDSDARKGMEELVFHVTKRAF